MVFGALRWRIPLLGAEAGFRTLWCAGRSDTGRHLCSRRASWRTSDSCSTVAHWQWMDFDASTPILGPPSALSLIREMVSFRTGRRNFGEGSTEIYGR